MSKQVNIFLIIFAFVIALEKIAFSVIKRRDREAGLILNDRSYTLLGTLTMIFMNQDKRIARETEESFDDFLSANEKQKKSLRYYSIGYCCALFSLGMFFMVDYGLSSLVLMNFCLVVVGFSFLVTKSSGLVVLMLLYGIISSVFTLPYGACAQFLSLIAGIVITVKFVKIRREYRKKVTAFASYRLSEGA